MKMKLQSIAYVLVLALGACQSEEFEQVPAFSNRPIIFSRITMEGQAHPTRAEVSDPVSGEFPEGSKVGVLGYCLTESRGSGTSAWNTKKDACVPFMPDVSGITQLKGVELTKSMDGSWSYTPLKKWYENDEGYQYSFFAYAPYDDAYFTISTVNYTNGRYFGAPVATFHLPFTTTQTSDALDRTLLRDAMLSNNIDHQSTDGNVSFQFYHMTAGLRFAVNNYDDANSVTIESLTLSGTFNKEMRIEAQTNYAISGSYSGTFTIADQAMTVQPLEQSRFFTVGGGEDAAKVTLLLIPNEDSNQTPIMGVPGQATPKVNVVYHINDGSAQPQSYDLPPMNYRQGVMHNISLDFLGNSLTLTASSTEWDNEYISDIVFE